MYTRSNFENILMVNKAIHYIYRSLGARYVKEFAETFNFDSNYLYQDSIIGAQYLAKKIANHYHLPVKAVVVTFSSSLKQPGIVELSSSDDFFVELQIQYQSDPKSIAAILAHEVAHIFLHKSNMRFPEEHDNEVLTDTVAAYFGFGPTILNAVTQNKRRVFANTVETKVHHFGYLSLQEFGYILAKRDAVYGRKSSRWASIPENFPSAVRSGASLYYNELGSRPLIPRPWSQSFLHSLSQLKNIGPPMDTKSIEFSCPCCSQRLRIPELFKKLSVHCQNCESRFPCFS